MPDPIIVKNRLDSLTAHHAVFEPDQVLTHHQLNSVADYLDDQGALTRVDGLGVGIVAGLHLAVRGEALAIGRGLGLTTDGDLLRLAADTLYDQFRIYDDAAPRYAPFFGGANSTSGAMFEMVELVAKGESDVLARPLVDLPGWRDRVVVLLAECAENDPDLCTGADCDNLGRDALHRQRVLLLRAEDAKAMLSALPSLASAADLAALLPAVIAARPQLGPDVGTTLALAQRYRDATAQTLTDLRAAFATLPRTLAEAIDEVFAGNPVDDWNRLLDRHTAAAGASPAAALLWYDAVKDLAETWNAMREALFDDDSVAVPDLRAFQKHLLLGQPAAPRQWRTALYPSPLVAGTRKQLAHAKFLLWKLQVLLASFAVPRDQRLAVTPSQGEAVALEERAIPWYFALRPEAPVHVGWNFRLASRDPTGQRFARDNLGYRAAEWQGSAHAQRPLTAQIAGHDFFRVEGHLGQPADAVAKQLEALLRAHNLPFSVMAVLLHNERRFIRVKPTIRYTDLHRFHQVLRKDIENDLQRSRGFSAAFKGEIDRASGAAEIPAQVGGSATTALASARHQALDAAAGESLKAFSKKGYTAFRQETAWKAQFSLATDAAAGFKQSFGNVLRTDVSTAFDHLVNNPRRQWLDWLDVLIDKKDEQADERLLFARFVREHPGIDHLGGVWRGGTLVLVYDDSGAVVADFALPYRLADDDTDDDEPDLPVAPLPPLIGGIKLIKPLEAVAETIQRDYTRFYTESLVTLGDVFKVKPQAVNPGSVVGPIRDAVLYANIRRVEYETAEVERLRQQALDTARPPAEREALQRQLDQAEAALGKTVGEGTRYIVANKVDVASGGDGANALLRLTQGASTINNNQVRTELGSGLLAIETEGRVGNALPQADAVANFRLVTGFGR